MHRLTVGLALLLAGSVVVALPDSDRRVFSISETHGPSWLDALGIVVAFAGWAVLVSLILHERSAVRRGRGFAGGVAVFLLGAVVLAVTVPLDLGWWWVIGALLMAAPQAVALGLATRAAKSP